MNPLLDAWNIHARINLFLLEPLTDEQLDAKPAKGRAPRAQFVHIHNVRLMWLKSAAPELLADLPKLENDATKEAIVSALEGSTMAVNDMIAGAETLEGRIKGFKPHAAAFVGYLISHESHHRGQLELSLRLAGVPISDKTSFGLWEWGVR